MKRRLVGLGVVIVAVGLSLRPEPCGACTPSFFAETLVLRLEERTVDGVLVEVPTSPDDAYLTSHGPIESLVLMMRRDSTSLLLRFVQ